MKQKCVPINECPYTLNLLKQGLRNRKEKNNIFSELTSFICNQLDRTVCCDLEDIPENSRKRVIDVKTGQSNINGQGLKKS